MLSKLSVVKNCAETKLLNYKTIKKIKFLRISIKLSSLACAEEETSLAKKLRDENSFVLVVYFCLFPVLLYSCILVFTVSDFHFLLS